MQLRQRDSVDCIPRHPRAATGNAPRRNNRELAPHVGVGVDNGMKTWLHGMFPLD